MQNAKIAFMTSLLEETGDSRQNGVQVQNAHCGTIGQFLTDETVNQTWSLFPIPQRWERIQEHYEANRYQGSGWCNVCRLEGIF